MEDSEYSFQKAPFLPDNVHNIVMKPLFLFCN
nr:MAG TPA: hypothetical protein [Caudoviricetes sp.]